jgi:hypothetical protein
MHLAYLAPDGASLDLPPLLAAKKPALLPGVQSLLPPGSELAEQACRLRFISKAIIAPGAQITQPKPSRML